jgi:hypothetical protein
MNGGGKKEKRVTRNEVALGIVTSCMGRGCRGIRDDGGNLSDGDEGPKEKQ